MEKQIYGAQILLNKLYERLASHNFDRYEFWKDMYIYPKTKRTAVTRSDWTKVRVILNVLVDLKSGFRWETFHKFTTLKLPTYVCTCYIKQSDATLLRMYFEYTEERQSPLLESTEESESADRHKSFISPPHSSRRHLLQYVKNFTIE